MSALVLVASASGVRAVASAAAAVFGAIEVEVGFGAGLVGGCGLWAISAERGNPPLLLPRAWLPRALG